MLTRRNFIMGAGAVAAAFMPKIAEASVAFQAWHDQSEAEHKAKTAKWAALGYNTITLCSYGPVTGLRYAAVMVKRMWATPEQHVVGKSWNEFLMTRNTLQAQGLYPALVTASGSGDAALFSVVFRKTSVIPVIMPNLTGNELQQQNFEAMLQGRVLVSADAYGDAKNIRFAAIWSDDPASTGWTCNSGSVDDGLNDDPARTMEVFDAQTGAGIRLAHIVPTPSGGYMTMYSDSKVGEWIAQGEMSSASYQAAFDTYTAKGLIPIRVMAKTTPAGDRFAAIFATSDQLVPRSVRFSTTTPAVQAIEDVLTEVITQGDVRGLSVAITRGPRLVYAKGVSFGEPDYPQILPETPFRQASISKVLCTTALYAILQKGHDFKADPLMDGPLSRKMQDILNVSPPPGMTQDPNWAKVTLRHLLESNSGINFGTPWASRQAVSLFPLAQLPAYSKQYLSWASVQKFTKTPGDKSNVIYGNDGYLILGEVVRTLAGTSDLAEAVQKLVCAPLGMKHTRASLTRIDWQPADEARYHNRIFTLDDQQKPHLVPLTVVPSCMFPEQPLAAYQYGYLEYETEQGCGGLSVAAIDIARIMAMFNTEGLCPVLSADAMAAMLNNSQNAALTLTGPNPGDVHGFHGFDGVQAWGKAQRASKGGWLPSHECSLDFVTGGGCGVIMQFNGNKRKEATFSVGKDLTNWMGKLYDIAYNGAWDDSIDLFHTVYGMKSLAKPAPAPIKPIVLKNASGQPVTIKGQSFSAEASAMTRGAGVHPATHPRPSVPGRTTGPMTLKRPVGVGRPRGA